MLSWAMERWAVVAWQSSNVVYQNRTKYVELANIGHLGLGKKIARSCNMNSNVNSRHLLQKRIGALYVMSERPA